MRLIETVLDGNPTNVEVLANSGVFADAMRRNGFAADEWQPARVKVKQLEWENGICDSPFGRYKIWDAEGCGFCVSLPTGKSNCGYGTEEEAKAACQSDFERRVRECLEENGG
jgi:hypothetical protein